VENFAEILSATLQNSAAGRWKWSKFRGSSQPPVHENWANLGRYWRWQYV